MEKIRLFHRSPLFPSTFVSVAASFKICSCPKRRVLSSSSNRTDHEGQLAKKQSSMYPGVPVSELVRGWFLYNLFRSNYLVDNGLQVSKVALWVTMNLALCLDDEVYKIHSWMVTDGEIAKGYNF